MILIRNVTIIGCVILLLLNGTKVRSASVNAITGNEYRYVKALVVAFFLVLTFVAAFRQGFVDTGTYKQLYQKVGTEFASAFDDTLPIEHGFSLFMVLLNRINPDPQFLVAITSLIIFSIDVYVLQKYSQDLPFTLYLYLVTSYMSSMNGIRQIMVASILSLALAWLIERKPVPYIALVLLLSTFHTSVLIMIPLYFVIAGRRLNWGIWLFAAGIIAAFAFPELIMQLLGKILEDSAYADYLEVDSKMGVMRLIIVTVPLLLTLLYSEFTKGTEYEGRRLMDVLINMHVLSFGFTALGLKMVYFARLGMYFGIVLPLLLPVTISRVFEPRSAKAVKLFAIILYMALFIYQLYAYKAQGYMNSFKLIF